MVNVSACWTKHESDSEFKLSNEDRHTMEAEMSSFSPFLVTHWAFLGPSISAFSKSSLWVHIIKYWACKSTIFGSFLSPNTQKKAVGINYLLVMLRKWCPIVRHLGVLNIINQRSLGDLRSSLGNNGPLWLSPTLTPNCLSTQRTIIEREFLFPKMGHG